MAILETIKPPKPKPSVSTRTRSLIGSSIAVQGAALIPLVAHDGSPAWLALRVVAVVLLTAAALAYGRTAGRAGLGTTALVLGVLGTSVGAGIGVMHAVKGAWSVITVAGLLVFATGLLLLLVGSGTLTRLLRGWWRLLAVPAALAIVQFLLIPLPIAVYATNAPPTAVGDVTPAEVGLQYADVELTTADGVSLTGWYVPSANGAAVALLHGSGSTRSAVLDRAVVLAEAGYGVLLYDDRGHGRSGGEAMEFGWWGDLDLAAAVSYLQAKPDVDDDRIGVVGMSMGGEQALNAAASDPRIGVVVAEGVEPRVPADLSYSAGIQSWTEWAVNTITVETAGLLTDAPAPLPVRDAVTAIAPRPVLLIAGRGEIEFVREVHAAAPTTVEVWELPDTPHTDGLALHRDEWRDRVTDFLASALAG